MRSASSLCVCLYIPPVSVWMPERIFIKLGVYVISPEPISMAYFIKLLHQSVCLYVHMCIPFIVSVLLLSSQNISA
jgi:hypothetical protein